MYYYIFSPVETLKEACNSRLIEICCYGRYITVTVIIKLLFLIASLQWELHIHVPNEKTVFFEKDNSTGKNRRQQEKRKMESEMDWLHKRSHKRESTGAERGCCGQDFRDITVSFIGSPGVRANWKTHNMHMPNN